MWISISKTNDALYQDGKVVKQITVDGKIVDIVNHGNTVWIKVV